VGDTIMTDIEIRNLQQQIVSLGERMEKGFDELKRLFSGMDERVRTVENREASCQPALSGRIDAAWRSIEDNKSKLGEHDRKIDAIEKAMGVLVHTNNILKWLLGISTAGLTALLIKLIVGT